MFLHDSQKEKVKQILEACGLDFTIFKKPMSIVENYDALTTRSDVTPTPYFALVNGKSGNVINSVKSGYTISQNVDIVSMVVAGMSKFGDQLEIVKGGSLNDGRKVFLQLRIKGDAKVGNDTIQKFVTIIDSNDGSTSLSVGIGDLTMSCMNQFYQFARSGQKSRHTSTIGGKIKALPLMIEEALEQSMIMINRYKTFQSTPCSRNMAHEMVNHLLGFDKATMTKKEYAELSTRNENAMNSLYNNIETEMNSKGNNVWGLHSGVTRWTTHDKSAPKREFGREESAMTSTNYRVNQASLEFAESLV